MNKISIKIAYFSPQAKHIIDLQIAEGSTIGRAIEASGILQLFPEIDLSKQRVGIFGKLRELSDILQTGDRIEIYRPLIKDPKEIRRLKAKNKPNRD